VRSRCGWPNTRLGPVDILVCNAASNPYYSPLGSISDEQFRKVLDNNILSNHWLVQLTAPQMIERTDGAIIFVSSIGGLKGSPVRGATTSPRRPTCNSRETMRWSTDGTTYG